MRLTLAESIARKAHAQQTEQSTGDPYIRHIERVVALLQGEDAKTVAWLHDVIEDTPVTFAELEDAGFPPQTLRAVALLTRQTSVTYAAYIQAIDESGDDLAISVKLADLWDHLRPNCPARLRPRYEAAWLTLTGQKWVSRLDWIVGEWVRGNVEVKYAEDGTPMYRLRAVAD